MKTMINLIGWAVIMFGAVVVGYALISCVECLNSMHPFGW